MLIRIEYFIRDSSRTITAQVVDYKLFGFILVYRYRRNF